jgi:hypothetical protein
MGMLGASFEISSGECVQHAHSLPTLAGTCFSGQTVTHNLSDVPRRRSADTASVHTSAGQSQTDTAASVGWVGMLGAGSEIALGDYVRHANSLPTVAGTCFSGQTVTYNLSDHVRLVECVQTRFPHSQPRVSVGIQSHTTCLIMRDSCCERPYLFTDRHECVCVRGR